MKIEGTPKERVMLSEIKPGNCFYWNNQLFMRLDDNMRTSRDGVNDICMAVNFTSNKCSTFYENTVVQRVEAKIVIE